MKILWIVNTIFPYPSEKLNIKKNVFGGWLNGLAGELEKLPNIELAIATVYSEKTLKKFKDGNTTYYLIPSKDNTKYDKNLEKYWIEINQELKPDLVHIHGTEFAHGLAFLKSCKEVKSVVGIQGLAYACSKVYYANIEPMEILKNITIRDIIKRDTIFDAKRKMAKRGEIEKRILKKCDNVIGRTTWDYDNVKSINPKMKYFYLNETLREVFYNQNWNIDNIERHSIFLSQAWYPIKGLHMMLKALTIIKREFPDVKLYIAGNDFLTAKNTVAKLKRSGYSKYIFKLIKNNNLEENVIFTGILTPEKILEQYKKSHVFVCPSIIENESNALSEAAIIGMPTVCSYVGGIPDRVENNVNGLLYPFTEYPMLAQCIMKYLKNDELAIKHGKEAQKRANVRNNPDTNVKKLIEIYNNIINEER